MTYLHAFSTTKTPQSEPIPGSNQVENSAGGYSFAVNDWQRLTRFLILGAEGGSYYATERKLTKGNAEVVLRCIQADGKRTVDEIVAISDAGRAPKNDPALFALAMCAGLGDKETRVYALKSMPKVARIGTHLFHFAQYLSQFRNWGVAARKGVAAWYENRSVPSLAEQAIKYQQRDGWSHADLLRLAHPKSDSEAREAIYRYMDYGNEPDAEKRGTKVKAYLPYDRFTTILAESANLHMLRGAEAIKTATSPEHAAALITEHSLPREIVPTQFLDAKVVWQALLPDMGITALIRNLGKMSSIGLLVPGSETTSVVINHLLDAENLKRGRVHPITLLLALMTYKLGHGVKGSLKWEPVTVVIDALDKAFYLAFANVEPSNKVWEMWLDISGSMDGGRVAGIEGFTPRDASAAFALINANVEPQCEFYAFTTTPRKIDISPRQRLDDVVRSSHELARYMGGTDCAQPMLHALEAKRKVDVFCVLTDNETWAGEIHPKQALEQYRREVNQNAKLIVVGLIANEFSVADPNDPNSLDVVGFDASGPQVMSMFARGEI